MTNYWNSFKPLHFDFSYWLFFRCPDCWGFWLLLNPLLIDKLGCLLIRFNIWFFTLYFALFVSIFEGGDIIEIFFMNWIGFISPYFWKQSVIYFRDIVKLLKTLPLSMQMLLAHRFSILNIIMKNIVWKNLRITNIHVLIIRK